MQSTGSGIDSDGFPAAQANSLGDQALVDALAGYDPWLVGFTCYLWNIERTLWGARELKRRRPGVRIVLGGPEITADNAWVLQTPDYDFPKLKGRAVVHGHCHHKSIFKMDSEEQALKKMELEHEMLASGCKPETAAEILL